MEVRAFMLAYLKGVFAREHLALLFKVYLVFMAAGGILTAVALTGRFGIIAFAGFVCGAASGLLVARLSTARLYRRWRARTDEIVHHLGSSAA